MLTHNLLENDFIMREQGLSGSKSLVNALGIYTLFYSKDHRSIIICPPIFIQRISVTMYL